MLSYRIWKNTNIKLSSGYKLWQGRGGKRDWRDGGDSDGDYVYQRNEQDEGYCVEDGPDYPPRRKQAQPSTWYCCCCVVLCLNSGTAAAQLVFWWWLETSVAGCFVLGQ